MLTIYRIAYGLVLVAFLGNIMITSRGTIGSRTSFILLITAAVLLCSLFYLLIGFSRIRSAIFWSVVLAWEVLFVWYAWFGPAAPFALHEIHTFEAKAAAREVSMHYLKGGALFLVLFAWFLSLPIARMVLKGRYSHV